MDPRLKNGIIIVVTTIWATNFLAGLLVPSYETDQAINVAFMTIVGGLFALGARGKGKGGGDDNDSNSPPPSR